MLFLNIFNNLFGEVNEEKQLIEIYKNNKNKPSAKITKSSKQVLLKVIRISDNIHSKLKFNFNLDRFLQNFFHDDVFFLYLFSFSNYW